MPPSDSHGPRQRRGPLRRRHALFDRFFTLRNHSTFGIVSVEFRLTPASSPTVFGLRNFIVCSAFIADGIRLEGHCWLLCSPLRLHRTQSSSLISVRLEGLYQLFCRRLVLCRLLRHPLRLHHQLSLRCWQVFGMRDFVNYFVVHSAFITNSAFVTDKCSARGTSSTTSSSTRPKRNKVRSIPRKKMVGWPVGIQSDASSFITISRPKGSDQCSTNPQFCSQERWAKRFI